MSGNIPVWDQKVLCLRSGNRCAIPECRKILVIDKKENDRESIIGEIAHIKGENAGAPRYDVSMTDKERNGYDNLILMCRDHHKMIDDQYNTYTVAKLLEIKKNHEAWVRDSLEKEMVNVTFAELGTITNYLNSGQFVIDDKLTLIPPKDKIKRNNLSSETERLIIHGLLQVKQVESFIDKCPDVNFGERLRQGFVNEYERLLKDEHLSGDALFESLLDFASGGRNDFKERAAALAVLTYLFEKCEVFEK